MCKTSRFFLLFFFFFFVLPDALKTFEKLNFDISKIQSNVNLEKIFPRKFSEFKNRNFILTTNRVGIV